MGSLPIEHQRMDSVRLLDVIMRLAWPHNPLEVGFSYIGSAAKWFLWSWESFLCSVSINYFSPNRKLKRGQVYDLCFGQFVTFLSNKPIYIYFFFFSEKTCTM